MAKLPAAEDLNRVLYRPSSPNVRVPVVDYSAMARGAEDAGRGLSKLAAGISVASEEGEDYDTRKKLVDFKLAQETALEERRTGMAPGGTGFTEEFGRDYDKQAKALFKTIPQSQRDKVDLELVQTHAMLAERASKYEGAEAERHHVEGLNDSLTNRVNVVTGNPDRLGYEKAEGEKLIDLARLPPDVKAKARVKYGEALEGAAVTSRIAGAKSLADYKALQKDLFQPGEGQGRERVAGSLATPYKDQIKQFEGYAEKASWDYKQHSIGYGTKAKHAGEVIDKAEAEARFEDEIAKAAKIVDDFAPGLDAGTRAALTSLTYNSGTAWQSAGLGDAVKSGDLNRIKERLVQYNKAGGETLPGLVDRRMKEASWVGKDMGSAAGPEAPASPAGSAMYGNLDYGKRLALWSTAQGQYEKTKNDLKAELKQYDDLSVAGMLPSEETLSALKTRVEAIGDPETAAQYQNMIGTAAVVSEFQKYPATELAPVLQGAREAINKNATPEGLKRLQTLEKLQGTIETEVKKDALSWARRVGVVPARKGEPLKLDDPASMKQRVEDVTKVSQHYGVTPQYFSEPERAALGEQLKAGGPMLLNALGAITSNFGNEGAVYAMQEVSDKVPEAANVGWLVARGGSKQAIDDAAAGMALQQQKDFKPVVGPRAERLAQVKAAYSDALKDYPQSASKYQALADTIYEVRARKAGKADTFDPELYKGILAEVIGQNTVGDKTYGGVVNQGWWTPAPIVLPPDVDQDKWHEAIDMLTPADLDAAGLGRPIGIDGVEIPLSRIKNATLQQRGDGKYAIITGQDSKTGADLWVLSNKDGKTGAQAPLFEIDFAKLAPVLRSRRPDLFRSE